MEKTAVKGASSARTTYVAEAGLIAAVYAACTLVALLLLQGLAWGPVQFRISEALTVLAVLTPAAVPGLTIGCVIANLAAMVINGTGALGLLDVVFGSAATLIGALWCRKFAENPKVAMLGPVLANAIIVPAYLPILLQGLGKLFRRAPPVSIIIHGRAEYFLAPFSVYHVTRSYVVADFNILIHECVACFIGGKIVIRAMLFRHICF